MVIVVGGAIALLMAVLFAAFYAIDMSHSGNRFVVESSTSDNVSWPFTDQLTIIPNVSVDDSVESSDVVERIFKRMME